MLANTMHYVADQLQQCRDILLIHAEETLKSIEQTGLKRIGLPGNKFTMELNFFKDELKQLRIDTNTPLFDTTAIHAAAAVSFEVS